MLSGHHLNLPPPLGTGFFQHSSHHAWDTRSPARLGSNYCLDLSGSYDEPARLIQEK